MAAAGSLKRLHFVPTQHELFPTWVTTTTIELKYRLKGVFEEVYLQYDKETRAGQKSRPVE